MTIRPVVSSTAAMSVAVSISAARPGCAYLLPAWEAASRKFPSAGWIPASGNCKTPPACGCKIRISGDDARPLRGNPGPSRQQAKHAVAALGILWIVAVGIRRRQSVAGSPEVSDAERMVPSTSAPWQSTRTSD